MYTHTCIHAYMYTHTYTYTCAYNYTYTHTYTRAQRERERERERERTPSSPALPGCYQSDPPPLNNKKDRFYRSCTFGAA